MRTTRSTNRRRTYIGIGLFYLLFFSSAPLFAQGENLPNVVLILVDDLGYGDVSAFNEKAAFQTLYIDTLAASGMSFTDAHTSAALCTPTRYGILTGRYNWRSILKKGGFNGYSSPLIDRDRWTLADIFQQKGYRSALIGKWHLGWNWTYQEDVQPRNANSPIPKIDFSQPIQQGPLAYGFDYFYGLGASLSSPPYVYVENNLSTSIPKDSSVNYDEKAFWRKGPIGSDFRHVEVLEKLTDKSVEFIEQQAETGQPFFLYSAFTAPHAPIVPPTEFIGTSNTNAYGDFVLWVDHCVGKIMKAIRADKRLENTLVIFTSDNGQSPRADFEDDELPQAGHNGSYIYRGKKFDIYEGGHRVPFIASWPGIIPANSLSEETICTVDLMATLAELLQIDLPEHSGEDSYSILPICTKQPYPAPLREATVHHSSDGRFAIRKGKWKLILWPGSGGWAYPSTPEEMEGLPKFQLYNLEEDPSEQNNVVASFPELVNEMQKLLKRYIQDGRSTPGIPQKNDGPAYWAELEWMKGN